jgi:hypothetical protein
VSSTDVAPKPTLVPAAGTCVTDVTPQLSLDLTLAVKSGTSAWQFAPAETVWFEAQVAMTGAVVSTTVIVALHVELLPAASVAVIVTTVAPVDRLAPAAGDWVTVTTHASLVTTEATRSGTRAEQFASATSVCEEPQVVMLGAVVSTTVIVALHVELLPAASVTVITTAFAPNEATELASGDCVIVRDELQLSVATTPPVRSGITEAQFAAASSVWFAAHVAMAGAVVSFTVNEAVQVVVLPAASATVITTEVMPIAAVEPAAGTCVTDVTPQLSRAHARREVRHQSVAVRTSRQGLICSTGRDDRRSRVHHRQARCAGHRVAR